MRFLVSKPNYLVLYRRTIPAGMQEKAKRMCVCVRGSVLAWGGNSPLLQRTAEHFSVINVPSNDHVVTEFQHHRHVAFTALPTQQTVITSARQHTSTTFRYTQLLTPPRSACVHPTSIHRCLSQVVTNELVCLRCCACEVAAHLRPGDVH